MAKLRVVECREFFRAVAEKAEAMRIPVAMAVVNAEGHLLALERMDEAGFITPDTAIAKAFTMAAFRSMSPRFPYSIAINCAMAGCKPEYVPVVLTALEAMLDPTFHILSAQCSTFGGPPLSSRRYVANKLCQSSIL